MSKLHQGAHQESAPCPVPRSLLKSSSPEGEQANSQVEALFGSAANQHRLNLWVLIQGKVEANFCTWSGD